MMLYFVIALPPFQRTLLACGIITTKPCKNLTHGSGEESGRAGPDDVLIALQAEKIVSNHIQAHAITMCIRTQAW